MRCQVGNPGALGQVSEQGRAVTRRFARRGGPRVWNASNPKISNVRIRSSSNGTALVVAPEEDGDDDDFVDMVIADMDFQQPSGAENIMRLPNPQSATESAAVSVIAEDEGDNGGKTGALQIMPSAARALKIENAWSASELKMRNRQLAKAEQEIMIKDAEIAELRRQATSTDDQLRYTKSELIEYRQILQKKDDLLKQTYESLVGSARERSKLREELILVEKDLMDARDALHGWTTKLVDLKSVIESADEDDEGIDLDDKDLIEDGKKNQKYELFKAMKDSEEESSTSPEMTTAVDLLKDLQDLSEQLLADVQDDENTLSIMDD